MEYSFNDNGYFIIDVTTLRSGRLLEIRNLEDQAEFFIFNLKEIK